MLKESMTDLYDVATGRGVYVPHSDSAVRRSSYTNILDNRQTDTQYSKMDAYSSVTSLWLEVGQYSPLLDDKQHT